MAQKKTTKDTTVTVNFPGSMELTKRSSDNSMAIEARRGKELLGTLLVGRGSVEWWPKGAKVNSVKMRWRQFAETLEQTIK
jgi:hypothetical protein